MLNMLVREYFHINSVGDVDSTIYNDGDCICDDDVLLIGIPTTLSIQELLAQPRRRGFKPSKVLDKQISSTLLKTEKVTATVPMFSTRIPLPSSNVKRAIPQFINRREMAENNEIFKLTRRINKEGLKLDEEIALLGSFSGLTRASYMRGDEDDIIRKRLEYNQQLERLHRKKLGLQHKWINVMSTKRRNSVGMSLPKNAPMMPFIPGLKARIDKLSNARIEKGGPIFKSSPSLFKSSSLLKDIAKLKALQENSKSSELPPIKMPMRRISSVEEFQRAMNLPMKTPTEKKAEKEEESKKKAEEKLSLPPLVPTRPAARTRRTGVVSINASQINSLTSQSTPNLPEKKPTTRERRGSLSEIQEDLNQEDLGFKLNIFLSGLSNSNAEATAT